MVFRAQFSPHFVFNSLNAVQHFITSNDKKQALGGLKKFSLLLRHYMTRYGYDENSVEQELDMLKVYLQLQELRYEGKLKVYTDNDYLQEESHQCIPSMLLAAVLEDLVENLIKRDEDLVKLWISFKEHSSAFQMILRSSVAPFEKKEHPAKSSTLDYRLDLPTWKEHVEQLNQLEMYNIQYREENPDLLISQPPGVAYFMELTVPYVNAS